MNKAILEGDEIKTPRYRALERNFRESLVPDSVLALSSPKIKELTEGKEVVKVIVVPKKLVNIVVKG